MNLISSHHISSHHNIHRFHFLKHTFVTKKVPFLQSPSQYPSFKTFILCSRIHPSYNSRDADNNSSIPSPTISFLAIPSQARPYQKSHQTTIQFNNIGTIPHHAIFIFNSESHAPESSRDPALDP